MFVSLSSSNWSLRSHSNLFQLILTFFLALIFLSLSSLIHCIILRAFFLKPSELKILGLVSCYCFMKANLLRILLNTNPWRKRKREKEQRILFVLGRFLVIQITHSDFFLSPFILLPKLSFVFCSLEQVIFVMTSTLPLTGNIFSPLCSVQWVWAIMRHPGGAGSPAAQIVPCPHSKAKTQKSF